MQAIVLSLLLATSSYSQSSFGRHPSIKAKDFSCAEIRHLIQTHGRLTVKFWGPFATIFSAHYSYCNSFEAPEMHNFKAKNGERCRAMTCAFDNSRNR